MLTGFRLFCQIEFPVGMYRNQKTVITGEKVPAARKAYRAYVEKGIAQGRRPELVGGGLIRSAGLVGGQSAVPNPGSFRVKAGSLSCYWAVRELGFSATEQSKKLGVWQPSVSISAKRGERIVKADQLELVED